VGLFGWAAKDGTLFGSQRKTKRGRGVGLGEQVRDSSQNIGERTDINLEKASENRRLRERRVVRKGKEKNWSCEELLPR